MTELEKTNIGEGIARIPSGIAILTAVWEGRSTGMLASWVQQASFDPLMVSVCVRHGRPILELIERSGRFCMNLVGQDPGSLLRHFGKGFAPGDDAFSGLETDRSQHGVALAEAIAVLNCELADGHDAGDHRLLLGKVVSGGARSTASPYVHLRKTALAY